MTCPKNKPDLSDTLRKCRIGTAKFFTLLLLLYHTSVNSPGMKYGKSITTNVAISPQFLTKMTNDSDLEDEYIKEIGNMKKLDEQFAKQQADIGWRVEQGWAIDKDGNISSWAIGHKDSKEKSFLQNMSEKAEEILQKQLEKAKDTKEEKEVFSMKKHKEVIKKNKVDLKV